MKKLYLFFRKNWKLIFFVISLTLFYYLFSRYFNNKISEFDVFIYNIVTFKMNNTVTTVMKAFTNFCSIFTLVGILFLLLVLNKRTSFYALLNLVYVVLFNTAIKAIVKRPRPSGINLIVEKGFSFPSGHAMVSVAFYGYLLYIIYHFEWPKKIRVSICSLILVLMFMIGISRIYLGVHYASDVIAGFMLGTSYLMLFIKFFHNDFLIEKNEF